MPPRSASAKALAQVHAVKPALAQHVQLGDAVKQLALFPPAQLAAPRTKNHDWAWLGLDLADETVGRFECRRCHCFMERAGRGNNMAVRFFGRDQVKLPGRPYCEAETTPGPADTKAAYVAAQAAQGHDGTHRCHADGCEEPIHPAFCMCPHHWGMVPPAIKSRIWKNFRRGQEKDKQPSRAYLAAVRDAIAAVEAKEARHAR